MPSLAVPRLAYSEPLRGRPIEEVAGDNVMHGRAFVRIAVVTTLTVGLLAAAQPALALSSAPDRTTPNGSAQSSSTFTVT
jgi:hypothetical protein